MQQLEQLVLWTMRPERQRKEQPPKTEHLRQLVVELEMVPQPLMTSADDLRALKSVVDENKVPPSALMWRAVSTVYSARYGMPWR